MASESTPCSCNGEGEASDSLNGDLLPCYENSISFASNSHVQEGRSVIFPRKLAAISTISPEQASVLHLFRGLLGGRERIGLSWLRPNAPAPPPTVAPTATRSRTPPPAIGRSRRLAASMARPPRLAPGAAQQPPNVGPERPLRLRRR